MHIHAAFLLPILFPLWFCLQVASASVNNNVHKAPSFTSPTSRGAPPQGPLNSPPWSKGSTNQNPYSISRLILCVLYSLVLTATCLAALCFLLAKQQVCQRSFGGWCLPGLQELTQLAIPPLKDIPFFISAGAMSTLSVFPMIIEVVR